MTTQNIATAVAERLANIAPAVADKVVEHLVNKELTRRSEAVIGGLSELDKLKGEFKKLKPDVNTFNEDGSAATSSWTKPKLEEKNKAEQKIAKLTKAIDKALNDNDYSDLYNFSKNTSAE
jgi:hypothetical protein